MYIENVTLKSVPADSLVLPVEEGTILTKNGTIPADLSQAYGIVPEKITNIPPTKKIYLAVAGTIDLKLNNVSFTEEEMQALGKDFNFVPGDEGGGNPNRVQTIEGTLAEPWGDVDVLDLFEKIGANNATAIIEVDGTAIGAPVITQYLTNVISQYVGFTYFMPDGNGAFLAAVALYEALSNFALASAITYVGTAGDPATFTENFIEDYASAIPTTLTIIWHPLPDQS